MDSEINEILKSMMVISANLDENRALYDLKKE